MTSPAAASAAARTARLSASVSLMFREYPVEGRVEAAAAAGFAGVEIQRLSEAPVSVWAAAAKAAGVKVALINVDLGDFLTGGPGLSGVLGREAAFRTAFDAALEAAEALGAEGVHVGPSRVPAGAARDDCLDAYRRNLDWAAEAAARRRASAQLLIEPVNRVDAPDVLISDIAEAARLIEAWGAGVYKLIFDVYHLAMNGEDLPASFSTHKAAIGHVQFSDPPGRRPPGLGTLEFPSVFAVIRGGGYAGWMGAEYVPPGPTMDSLDWMGWAA